MALALAGGIYFDYIQLGHAKGEQFVYVGIDDGIELGSILDDAHGFFLYFGHKKARSGWVIVRARENCRQVFTGMALFYVIMVLNLKASMNKRAFLVFRGSNNFLC
jgi:hypothetical protein